MLFVVLCSKNFTPQKHLNKKLNQNVKFADYVFIMHSLNINNKTFIWGHIANDRGYWECLLASIPYHIIFTNLLFAV